MAGVRAVGHGPRIGLDVKANGTERRQMAKKKKKLRADADRPLKQRWRHQGRATSMESKNKKENKGRNASRTFYRPHFVTVSSQRSVGGRLIRPSCVPTMACHVLHCTFQL